MRLHSIVCFFMTNEQQNIMRLRHPYLLVLSLEHEGPVMAPVINNLLMVAFLWDDVNQCHSTNHCVNAGGGLSKVFDYTFHEFFIDLMESSNVGNH